MKATVSTIGIRQPTRFELIDGEMLISEQEDMCTERIRLMRDFACVFVCIGVCMSMYACVYVRRHLFL